MNAIICSLAAQAPTVAVAQESNTDGYLGITAFVVLFALIAGAHLASRDEIQL